MRRKEGRSRRGGSHILLGLAHGDEVKRECERGVKLLQAEAISWDSRCACSRTDDACTAAMCLSGAVSSAFAGGGVFQAADDNKKA